MTSTSLNIPRLPPRKMPLSPSDLRRWFRVRRGADQAVAAEVSASRRRGRHGGGRGDACSTPGASSRTGSRSFDRPLPIAGLPEALVGKRLVQVSDLHVGTVVDQPYLLVAWTRVAALKPDMIVLTGDFMTCHRRRAGRAGAGGRSRVAVGAAGPLRRPRQPRLRRLLASGAVADKLTDGFERHDVRMLRNEVADVGGLQIGGRRRLVGREFSGRRAMLAQLDSARPRSRLPQPRRRRPSGWREFPRLDPGRAHARRPVQAAVHAAADAAGEEQTLRRRRVRTGGRPTAVHQPRARLSRTTCGSTAGRRSRCSR